MLENRSVTPEQLAEVANRILHPYSLEVKDVGWWSVYEIGQRLCDRSTTWGEPERTRGCSSPATPATPTARRPGRA